MKTHHESTLFILARRLLLAGFVSLVPATRMLAQSYSLTSSISSGILNSSWTAFQANPNGFTSSYSITAGSEMTLNNREWLYLTNPLSPSNTLVTVGGTFDITSPGDFLTVALHTDADTTPGVGRGLTYGVDLDSLQVTFSTFGGNLGVSIAAVDNTESGNLLINVPYTFNTGQNYNFSITDNGSLLDVYVGGSLLTSYNYISSPYYMPSGTNVLFYNRESVGGFDFSNLTISAVPEPSTFALLAAGMAALGALLGYRTLFRKPAR
jgi:hypothetical protein